MLAVTQNKERWVSLFPEARWFERSGGERNGSVLPMAAPWAWLHFWMKELVLPAQLHSHRDWKIMPTDSLPFILFPFCHLSATGRLHISNTADNLHMIHRRNQSSTFFSPNIVQIGAAKNVNKNYLKMEMSQEIFLSGTWVSNYAIYWTILLTSFK